MPFSSTHRPSCGMKTAVQRRHRAEVIGIVENRITNTLSIAGPISAAVGSTRLASCAHRSRSCERYRDRLAAVRFVVGENVDVTRDARHRLRRRSKTTKCRRSQRRARSRVPDRRLKARTTRRKRSRCRSRLSGRSHLNNCTHAYVHTILSSGRR